MKPGRTLDIVFDGPPAPESGRFVEVEIDGQAVSLEHWKIGRWEERDGRHILAIDMDALGWLTQPERVTERLRRDRCSATKD